MDTAHTLSITEARKRIFDLAQKTQTPGVYFTLTEKGKPRMVLLSAEEYESMVETMEVERIFPDLDKDIAAVKKAMKTGEWEKWSTLEDVEKKWGITPAHRLKKKYGIPSTLHTKSRKSTR